MGYSQEQIQQGRYAEPHLNPPDDGYTAAEEAAIDDAKAEETRSILNNNDKLETLLIESLSDTDYRKVAACNKFLAALKLICEQTVLSDAEKEIKSALTDLAEMEADWQVQRRLDNGEGIPGYDDMED